MRSPTPGRIVIYHGMTGAFPAIIVKNHGQRGHELHVFWDNATLAVLDQATASAKRNPTATEGMHVGGWSWPDREPSVEDELNSMASVAVSLFPEEGF